MGKWRPTTWYSERVIWAAHQHLLLPEQREIQTLTAIVLRMVDVPTNRWVRFTVADQIYSRFSRLHLIAGGQVRVCIVQACVRNGRYGQLLVQFYSSTAIAVSIVSSTLDNVGFVENRMSLRTWAMRPCCASTAIFVLKIRQLHRPTRSSEDRAPTCLSRSS